MRSGWGFAVRRRAVGTVGIASLSMAVAMLPGGTARGQVTPPRYHSPIEAPTPQPFPPLPAPAPVTPGATVVEYPIVRVNDQIIDNSDYEREQQLLLEGAQQANSSPNPADHVSAAELAQRQKNLLRDMIDRQLLLSRGKELEVNADSEVIRRLDEIRKEHNLDSMEALEKAVRDSGMAFEDFKEKIREDVITQEVERDEVARNLRLTGKDEQAYYDAHKQDFQQPEQLQLSEILIPTPENATDAQVAQAKAKADDIEAKLKAGAKFEDMAKQYSGGETASTGGDMGGVFKRGDGRLAKVLEDQTFPLKAGEWTAPIRTRPGYLILEVTQHTPGGIPPLSAVDQQVQEAMYEAAMQPALRTYLTDLREKAFIDIAPGFVDTGASPKQTKPVFAGATVPAPKKKVVQKERLNAARAAAAEAKANASTHAAAISGANGGATTPGNSAAKTVEVSTGKKPKKIKREKIRYGQMPRNSLPESPEETLATAADKGPGAPVNGDTAGDATAAEQSPDLAANTEPENPVAPERKKTRYSDRAPIEAQAKAKEKAAKLEQKKLATPAPATAEEKAADQAQNAPIGLGGDTATKKKPKKVKGAPKERIQQAPPTPPSAKPEATPIPPKSVRDNGEPAASPPPSNLPPVTPPSGAQPSSTASPAPTPPPQQ